MIFERDSPKSFFTHIAERAASAGISKQYLGETPVQQAQIVGLSQVGGGDLPDALLLACHKVIESFSPFSFACRPCWR